jgi:peptidyl-prolyl cis-trans isomerase C
VKTTLSFVLVLALVAGACSDTSGEVIATIDGDSEVTVGDVAELFESDSLPIDSGLRDAIFAVVARQILLDGLAADFGIELDTARVDEVYADLIAQMEAAGMTPAESLGVPDAGTGMIRFNAEIGVIRQQVTEGLATDPGFVTEYFSDPAAYTTVCARHILVDTEEAATAVLERLEGGEEFAAVAAEVSLDSPTGELGCSPASRYVTEFAEATLTADVGVYTGPVQTTFGYHVLVVDERTAPTDEEIAADPLSFLTDADLNIIWSEWLNDTIGVAEVELDPRYGTWSDVGIVPPDED